MSIKELLKRPPLTPMDYKDYYYYYFKRIRTEPRNILTIPKPPTEPKKNV